MRYRLLRSGKEIDLTGEIKLGVGGEAQVFAVTSLSMAAKVYHVPKQEHIDKLIVMVENPPADPTAAQGHVSIAWPADLLIHPGGGVSGYVMPLVKGMDPLVNYYVPKLRRQERPLFDYRYLVTAALNVATAVRALHDRNYVIGDVNESNILVAETALATVVDTDSFQVPDPTKRSTYRCPVGKPEFTPPELYGKDFARVDRKPEHDRFGLAVLLFQLLMEGTHPFDGVYCGRGDPKPIEERIRDGHFPHAGHPRVPWRPKPIAPPFGMLDPALQRLFLQCFTEGHARPSMRPNAATWRNALSDASKMLRVCGVNEQHRHWGHVACPWCERAKRLRGADPFPSKLAVKQQRHLQRRSSGAPTPSSAPTPSPPLRPPVASRQFVRSSASPTPALPFRPLQRWPSYRTLPTAPASSAPVRPIQSGTPLLARRLYNFARGITSKARSGITVAAVPALVFVRGIPKKVWYGFAIVTVLSLISALLLVNRPGVLEKQMKAYILDGHGEYGFESPQNKLLKEQLTRENIKADILTLANLTSIPDDADALMLLGPRSDYSERELKLLTEYWDRKGRFFIAIGPVGKKPGLDAWLAERGVKPAGDTVLRVVNLGGITGMMDLEGVIAKGSPVTENLEDVGVMIGGQTQSLTLDRTKETKGRLRLTGLMAAPEGFWGETEYAADRKSLPFFDSEKDHAAPLAIGVAVEDGALDNPTLNLKTARMVVFGNGDLFSAEGFQEGSTSLDLATNALNWLLNREFSSRPGRRAKGAKTGLPVKGPSQGPPVSKEERRPEARVKIGEGAKAGEEREIEIADGLMVVMCWVPANEVSISPSPGFWLAKTECTQKVWRAVVGNNPSYFQGEDLPVEQVSYDDAQSFMRKLKPPGDGWRFDLPTEAQWQHACSAWTGIVDAGGLDALAWYDSNSRGKAHPVGTKQANAWGLQDMLGNVSEWCRDPYVKANANEWQATVDRNGKSGSARVTLGGSWLSDRRSFRSATRYTQDYRNNRLGFRLAAVPSSAGGAAVAPAVPPGPREDRGWAPLVAGTREGSEREVEIGYGATMTMCWIPAGAFTMGSPITEANRSYDEARVQVKISGYWLAKHECTQRVWSAVMGSNPSQFKGESLPVENVSWKDCQQFTGKLAKPGKGWRFDLPTEAQWEYACRASTSGPYAGTLGEFAWYTDNSERTTHPVGSKKANAWGLMDMHGNVWEWCRDAYVANLPGGTDPFVENGASRVLRGGSWFDSSWCCRSADRRRYSPESRDGLLGFRLAAVPSNESGRR